MILGAVDFFFIAYFACLALFRTLVHVLLYLNLKSIFIKSKTNLKKESIQGMGDIVVE